VSLRFAYLAVLRVFGWLALLAKAVVLIHPRGRLGEVVWPV